MKGLVLSQAVWVADAPLQGKSLGQRIVPSSVEDVLRGDLGFAVCESGHFWT